MRLGREVWDAADGGRGEEVCRREVDGEEKGCGVNLQTHAILCTPEQLEELETLIAPEVRMLTSRKHEAESRDEVFPAIDSERLGRLANLRWQIADLENSIAHEEVTSTDLRDRVGVLKGIAKRLD